MKIDKIYSQHRRDIHALFKCQFCGSTFVGEGYDDTHYHEIVIPKMECPTCKKSVDKNKDELEEEYRPLTTKYPSWAQL